jgi:hypothetical protein
MGAHQQHPDREQNEALMQMSNKISLVCDKNTSFFGILQTTTEEEA